MKIEQFEDIISWKKAKGLNYPSGIKFDKLSSVSIEISKSIYGFIKT
jgi:hypothetical protein